MSRARAAGALAIVGALLVSAAMISGVRPADPAPPSASWRVDLGSASREELALLPGIGPALAARIVESRRVDGPFRSVDDLARVRGIGPVIVERVRPWIAPDRPPGRP